MVNFIWKEGRSTVVYSKRSRHYRYKLSVTQASILKQPVDCHVTPCRTGALRDVTFQCTCRSAGSVSSVACNSVSRYASQISWTKIFELLLHVTAVISCILYTVARESAMNESKAHPHYRVLQIPFEGDYACNSSVMHQDNMFSHFIIFIFFFIHSPSSAQCTCLRVFVFADEAALFDKLLP